MGEESERQGMNHGNSDVSHPKPRVRMTDGMVTTAAPSHWLSGEEEVEL